MTDRYAAHRAIARDLGVDAVALVPGPNFERLYGALELNALEKAYLERVKIKADRFVGRDTFKNPA